MVDKLTFLFSNSSVSPFSQKTPTECGVQSVHLATYNEHPSLHMGSKLTGFVKSTLKYFYRIRPVQISLDHSFPWQGMIFNTYSNHIRDQYKIHI